MTTNQTKPHPVQVRSAAALFLPGVLAFTIPPVGFLATLLLPFFAARVRARLWPRTSPGVGHLCAALAVVGLWLPAVLAMVSGGRLGSEATLWLMIPLCAPTGAALVWPAALAIAAYLIGTAIAVVARSPWPWVLGAWAAPLAYSAAGLWLVDFTCIA